MAPVTVGAGSRHEALAASFSRGTKPPRWRARSTLGQQTNKHKFKVVFRSNYELIFLLLLEAMISQACITK